MGRRCASGRNVWIKYYPIASMYCFFCTHIMEIYTTVNVWYTMILYGWHIFKNHVTEHIICPFPIMNSYCQSIELQPFVMGFQNWVVVDVLSKTWSFQATQAVFTPQQIPCNGNLQMVATREVMKWILNRRYLFAASQKNKKKTNNKTQKQKHKNIPNTQ